MSKRCYQQVRKPIGLIVQPPISRRGPNHITISGADFNYSVEGGVTVGVYASAEISGFRSDGVFRPTVFASNFNNRLLEYGSEFEANSGTGQIKIKLDQQFGADTLFEVKLNW